MLSLLAVAFEDGLAFVRRGDRIVFTKPPYLGSNLAWTDEETVERAVSKYGFSKSDKVFGNWTELITFLKNEFLKARKNLGLERAAELEDLLVHAPAYVLKDYLNK